MRAQQLTPEFFGSDDPNFNLEAAIDTYKWFMREEEEVAKFVMADVSADVISEEISKNYDGFVAYINKEAAKRREIVKKSLARAIAQGTMSDEAVDEVVHAMEMISKAEYTDDERSANAKKQTRGPGGRFTAMGRSRVSYPKRSGLINRTDKIGSPKLQRKAEKLKPADAKEFEAAYEQVTADLARLGINKQNKADAVLTMTDMDGNRFQRVVTGVSEPGKVVEAEDFDEEKKRIDDITYYPEGAGLIAHGGMSGGGSLNPVAVQGWRGIDTAQMMQMQNDPELSGATRGMRNVGNAATFIDGLNVTNNPKLKFATEAGKLIGDMGPEAETVIGPSIRRAAYRYRGTERKTPDKDIAMALDATLRPLGNTTEGITPQTIRRAVTQPRIAEGTDDTYASPLVRAMQNRLPDPALAELHANSGKITPSEGILLSQDGKILSQSVGNADDHYLPFNLRKIASAKNGSYVRTRAFGGPTTEDIYTGLMANLDSMTVVSNSGTYSITFDESFKGGRRFNDKALRMKKRYGELVDAVQSRKVQLDAIPGDRMKELKRQVVEEVPGNTPEVLEERAKRLDDLQNAERKNPSPSQKQIDEWAEEFQNKQAEKWSGTPAGEMTWDQVKAQASLQAGRALDSREAIEELGLAEDFDNYIEAKSEQYSYDKGPLSLNGSGYHKALLGLQEQFPYYIKDVSFIPAGNNRTDAGYVKPRHNRPQGVRTGYFDPTIEGTEYADGSGKRRADMDNYVNRGAYDRLARQGQPRSRGAFVAQPLSRKEYARQRDKAEEKEKANSPDFPSAGGGSTGASSAPTTAGTSPYYPGFTKNPQLLKASEGSPYQKAMAAVKIRQKLRSLDKVPYKAPDKNDPDKIVSMTMQVNRSDSPVLSAMPNLMGANAINLSDDQFMERMFSDPNFAAQVGNEISVLAAGSGSTDWKGAVANRVQDEIKFFVGEKLDNPSSPQILANRLATKDKKLYDFTQPSRRIDGRNYLPGQPKAVYEAAWKSDSDISRFTASSERRFGYRLGLGQDKNVFDGMTSQFGKSMTQGLGYVDTWRRQAKEYGGARNIPEKTVVEYGGKKYSPFSANDLEKDIAQDALALTKMHQLKGLYSTADNTSADDAKPIVDNKKVVSLDADIRDPEKRKSIEENGLKTERRSDKVAQAKKTLNSLTGLDDVKKQVNDLIAETRVNERRKEMGLPVKASTNHLIFTGAPGTGKTTVANALGDAYYGIGVTEKPDVTMVSRADLVGQYLGETSKKSREVFNKAKGGVLFIDEAYSLVSGEGDQYGYEAVDELIQFAENNRDNTVVILAGYPDSMNMLLESNPGMKSRFPRSITFPNYSAEEIDEIQQNMLGDLDYSMDEKAKKAITNVATQIVQLPNYSNARDARNFNDSLRRVHANRISRIPEDQLTENDLKTITQSDIADASKEFLRSRTGT